MATSGAPTAITGTATDLVPPEPDFLILPLNLRAQLGRFGIGADDLIVIDGMPEDAALTAGAKKPDGSWSLREVDLDTCSFMPLYGNGETYTLRACVLAPDPSDHGLAKTKGKAEIKVEVPLTPLPILEDFDDGAVPASGPVPSPETVILLPADPKLKATAPVPQPLAAPGPTASPAAALAASAASSPAAAQPAAAPKPGASGGTFDQKLAKLRAEWQAKVARQVAAAEERLKATHRAQLNRIQGALPQEAGQGSAAPESAAKAELPAQRTAGSDAEPRLDAQAIELRLAEARKQWQAEHEAALAQAREAWRSEEAARLAAVEAALAAKTSASPPAAQDWSAKLESALADAQVGWEADEAERRAKLEAEFTAAHERRIAELETQWQKAEAERLAAAEARWRAEYDRKVEAVLASFGTIMKGQLGALSNAPLLPATEPTAPQAQPSETAPPDAADSNEDHGWHKTAAA